MNERQVVAIVAAILLVVIALILVLDSGRPCSPPPRTTMLSGHDAHR